MKLSRSMLVLLIALLAAAPGLAGAAAEKNESEPAAEAEAPTGVGPDKGVTEASKEQGFKLSKKAADAMGVAVTSVDAAQGAFTVPSSALLSFQDGLGVYRLRDGFFKLVELKKPAVKSEAGGKLLRIASGEIKSGDKIATGGAELLRLTDLNIWGGDEGGE